MVNWIIIGVLLTVTGAAAAYLYREKKNGKKCIGCPDAGHCANCSGKKGL